MFEGFLPAVATLAASTSVPVRRFHRSLFRSGLGGEETVVASLPRDPAVRIVGGEFVGQADAEGQGQGPAPAPSLSDCVTRIPDRTGGEEIDVNCVIDLPISPPARFSGINRIAFLQDRYTSKEMCGTFVPQHSCEICAL